MNKVEIYFPLGMIMCMICITGYVTSFILFPNSSTLQNILLLLTLWFFAASIIIFSVYFVVATINDDLRWF